MQNYGYDHKKLFKDLEKSKPILIDGKNYKELFNITYTLEYRNGKTKRKAQPHLQDDHYERLYLLAKLDHCIEVLGHDIHSRRAAFSNLYENGLGKCIVLVQIFVRDGRLYINEYYRSQEASRNFEYDKETASLLMDKILDEFKEDGIKPGTITVMVMSFHKEIHKEIKWATRTWSNSWVQAFKRLLMPSLQT